MCSCTFHLCSLCMVFEIFSQTDSSLWELSFRRNFPIALRLRFWEHERTVALLFHVYSHRGGNCKRRLLCTVLSLGFVLYAGGIWKGDTMVADFEELENLDASEIHARRLDAKEVLMPKNGERSCPRSQTEQSSCPEEIRFSEDPLQSRMTLHEAKSTTMIFEERRTGLNPQTR